MNELKERSTFYNTGLAKVAVSFSADTFVLKIATSPSGKTISDIQEKS